MIDDDVQTSFSVVFELEFFSLSLSGLVHLVEITASTSVSPLLAAILISIFFTSCPHRVFEPSLLVTTFLIKRHHYPLLFTYLLFVFVFMTASVKTHSWNSCDYIKGLMFTWFIMNLIVYMVITL